MILVCTESERCNFHLEGNPTESKCPGYCEVGGCRDLVACEAVDEEADVEMGLCHGHAAVWHAQRAGIEGSVPGQMLISEASEVDRLLGIARAAAAVVFGSLGRTDDKRVHRLQDLLREFKA